MEEKLAEQGRILVVDDEESNVRLLDRFLRAKGYEVVTAGCGEEALAQVEKKPPDAILLDLMMPGVDGFEVCRRLKGDVHTRHIPVIIITGFSAHEANVKALEIGADDFLVKPFDGVLLAARIRSSLRTKMLQDQILSYQRQLEEANEFLEQRIRERTAQLARTQQVVVFSLAKLTESRDTETGIHLERIQSYVLELAKQLLEQPTYQHLGGNGLLEHLHQSSPLHDIGKVGIPDHILMKPGKLTTEEYEIMKTHTIVGGDTLRAADIEAGRESFLAMGRDIAYYHHERWDGEGYPFGLRGREIPLAARIVAVCDVYDALTSRRPYKDAFTHEASRKIILSERGGAFDPDVVDAFLARENEMLSIRTRLQDHAVLSTSQ